MVMAELKQNQIKSAKSEKLRRYYGRSNQYRQNKLFWCNQKALYKKLGGKERSIQVPPDGEEMKEFWSKLWDNSVSHKEGGEWLKKVELELERVNIQKKCRSNQGIC